MTRPTEAQEQAAVFEWAQWNIGKYPALKWMHHIPNGGTRHPAEAANLKRQGVRPGVSDVFLPTARGGYHGLYIEMKSKTGKPSDNQREFVEAMIGEGYKAIFCYGADEAICAIEKYLRMEGRNG